MFADLQTPVILALVTGVAALIAVVLIYVIKFIRTKISAESYARLRDVAMTAVAAVEQKWRSGQITSDARYKQAVDFIKLTFPNITDDEIKAAIESSVLLIKNQVDAATRPQLPPPPADKPLAFPSSQS